MGKYLIGVFFVIIAIFLAVTLWNGSAKETREFEEDVRSDIPGLYQDPYAPQTATPTTPTP